MAYRKQYERDMCQFLNARAEEVVCGGLVVILVPGRPNEVEHSKCIGNVLFEVLGCCLLDMAKEVRKPAYNLTNVVSLQIILEKWAFEIKKTVVKLEMNLRYISRSVVLKFATIIYLVLNFAIIKYGCRFATVLFLSQISRKTQGREYIK